MQQAYIGVVGPADAPGDILAAAHEVGRLLAGHGAIVVTGGLGGVMAAAARGASEAGGLTVGLLPDATRDRANPFNSITIPTGLGELRNGLIVRACAALVAVGCSWGTLSEIALAVRTGVPVTAIDGWELPPGPLRVASPAAAVDALVARGILW